MNPNPEPIFDISGEMSGGETPVTAASSSEEREEISVAGDGESNEASTSDERERKLAIMEKPPSDDVCPICFGNFVVPCRAPCGHWYCGEIFLFLWLCFVINRIILLFMVWVPQKCNLSFPSHYLPIQAGISKFNGRVGCVIFVEDLRCRILVSYFPQLGNQCWMCLWYQDFS